jgi:hypothetical protein
MIIQRIRALGLMGTMSCLFRKCYLHFVALWYGFDYWHASAPIECRPYKRETVQLANEYVQVCAMEIGCGLGDIISRVDSSIRIGVDHDSSVISAARKMHGNVVKFVTASVFDTNEILALDRPHKVDLLILINWPHSVAWYKLLSALQKLLQGMDINYIVIDGINVGATGYAFYHGEREFSKLGTIVRKKVASDGVRTLYLISVNDIMG